MAWRMLAQKFVCTSIAMMVLAVAASYDCVVARGWFFCPFVRFLFEIGIHLTKIFPFQFFFLPVHMLCGMFVLAFMVQNSIVGISWGYKSQRSNGWKIGMKQKTEQAQTLIVALVYLWGKGKKKIYSIGIVELLWHFKRSFFYTSERRSGNNSEQLLRLSYR